MNVETDKKNLQENPKPRVNLLGQSETALKDFFAGLNEKPFRARQILQWIHQRNVDAFDEMTDLSKNLREQLVQVASVQLPKVISWGPKGAEWQPNDKIWITFSEPMDPSSFHIEIVGMNFTFEMINDITVLITPLMILSRNMSFNVVVSGSDIAGNHMDDYHFIFSTGMEIGDVTNGGLIISIVNVNEDPIFNATVTISPQNIAYNIENGWRLSIEDIEPGDYEIEVKKVGYETQVIQITILAGTTHSEVVILEEVKEEETDPNYTPMIVLALSAAVIVAAFLGVILFVRSKDDQLEE